MIGNRYDIIWEYITSSILQKIYRFTDWLEKKRFERGHPLVRVIADFDNGPEERYMYHIR